MRRFDDMQPELEEHGVRGRRTEQGHGRGGRHIVDEDGVIRWIDQTDDYRLRSDNARVLGAVKSVFG